MPLTSELAERYGVSSSDLRRWWDRGWISGDYVSRSTGRPVPGGSGTTMVWRPWVPRMVALLMLRHEQAGRLGGDPRPLHGELMRAIARGLDRWPDAPWFVIGAGVPAEPAWTAEDAVEALLTEPGPSRVLVAVPDDPRGSMTAARVRGTVPRNASRTPAERSTAS